MRRKAIALLMTTVMAVFMISCGKNDNNTESSTPMSTGTGSSAQTETKKVALTVWAPSEDQSAENGNWLSTMCNQFNELHPEWNITFTYGVCAEGDAKATVTQDVEAAADVYMFANDNLTDLI